MLPRHHEPIVAIATAPGRGAVGIVRISARQLSGFIGALLGRTLRPREASFLSIRDGEDRPIDQCLAIYFPAPHSFTGEDVLELQGHGGPVVLQLLVLRCLEVAAHSDQPGGETVLAGLRLAQAGEFSERAFLNGRIDLAQAEAIADLIDASTQAAARSASQSLVGAFSRQIRELLTATVRLRTLVEATLDFPDEELDFLEQAGAREQLDALQVALTGLRASATQGALLRDGIRVVIAGQPNAGKSSLLNALAGAELAIVTPIAGTTRDKVQETIQIEGVPVHIIDTAGLRESWDLIERIGIERSWDAIGSADVVLFLHDLTRLGDAAHSAADKVILERLGQLLPTSVQVIDVWNKADAVVAAINPPAIALSAKTGIGLEQLRQRLLREAGWQGPQATRFMARERHLRALHRLDIHLQAAAHHLAAPQLALDLLAEELRLGQAALSQITGEFGADDLLGEIFSKFCIGK
jgi:tRNA modification GTPase